MQRAPAGGRPVSEHALLATFETEAALIEAARAVDSAGHTIVDAYAPYPIDGLPALAHDEASLVGWACLIGGVLGAAGGLTFQAWTSAVSWPLDIGGKPLLAWLAFVPVAFELMVLGAAAGAGLAFLILSRLRPRWGPPGLRDTWPHDRFVLEVAASGEARLETAHSLLRALGAVVISERGSVVAISAPTATAQSLRWLDRTLILIACAAIGLSLVLWPDATRRNLTYAPDMAVSPAVTTYSSSAVPGDAETLRAPVPGTVPRGPLPLHYEASEADALRAAMELQVPPGIAAEVDRLRGEKLFEIFCQPCHGSEGHGDGITIKRGFQPPPSLLTQHARDMRDGQMFHVITYGQKLMPSQASQVRADDRWRLIMHVRRLQQRLPVDPPPFGSPPATEPPPP
jgi:mono/diheme cytochrome c family protein